MAIGYKVVKRTKDPNRFLSALTSELMLEYEIGKTTVPNIGKLFVFDNLECARLFVKRMHLDESTIIAILECDVEDSEGKFQSPYALKEYFLDEGRAILFWGSVNNGTARFNETTMVLPFGTIMCDSVTPIREILDWPNLPPEWAMRAEYENPWEAK